MHLAWLEEFERIVKPGGTVIVTTFSRDVLERCPQWLSQDPESLREWQRRAVEIFSPIEDWLAAYDRGEFCYGEMPEFQNRHFGLTCIPERYVRDVWSKRFTVCEFRPPKAGIQAAIVCRRPPS